MRTPRIGLATIGTLSLFTATLGAQNPALSALTTGFVSPVRAAATLGAWRLAHPTDTVLRSWEGNGYVQCASAHSHRVISGGDTAEVRALFYVPALPSSRELPVKETPDQALDRCELGMVRITIHDTSAARITAIHRALQLDLAAARLFGDADVPWTLTAATIEGRARHDDSVVVASARYMGGTWGEVSLSCCSLTVHVAARRSHEHPELPGWDQRPVRAERVAPGPAEAPPAAKAWLATFADAAIGGPLEREMRATFIQLDLGQVSTDTVIPLLERWLRAAGPLPAERRAAALMIADSLMMGWAPFFDASPAGDTLHDRLARIGVPISLMRGEKDESYYSYRRDWAMQAWQIAPASRVGENAFLLVETDGLCSSDQLTVIARAESYLQRYPRTRIRGQLHALLGREWAGEVMINSVDASGEFSPAIAASRPRAAVARQRAIAHFQAAFRLNVEPEHTWNDAFLVLAGLPFTEGDGDCSP